MWSSAIWKQAGDRAFGDVTVIGDLWDSITKEYIGDNSHEANWKMMNKAARRLVTEIIPIRWKEMLDNMSDAEATAYEAGNRTIFEHCLIRDGTKRNKWVPLRKISYQSIYKVLMKDYVKEVDFSGAIEGPRQALSRMLGRNIPSHELWKEVRRYERNPKADDLLWRFLHAKVKVGMEIDWLLPDKKYCPCCSTAEDGEVAIIIDNVWINCKAARQVWDLFGGVWTRLTGHRPKILPTSKDTLIAMFARAPYQSKAAKVWWIILFTAAVWMLWRSYLDASIDGAPFNPVQVRVRYWEELCKIVWREKVLAVSPRYHTEYRHSLRGFKAIWRTEASAILLKGTPKCLDGLRLASVT